MLALVPQVRTGLFVEPSDRKRAVRWWAWRHPGSLIHTRAVSHVDIISQVDFGLSQTAVTGEPNWGAAVFLFVLAFASTLMLFSLDEGYEREEKSTTNAHVPLEDANVRSFVDPAIVRPHKVHDPRFVALAAQASKRVYAGAQDAKRVAANRLDSARMSSPAEGLLSVTESQDDGMVVANEMWVQAVTMKAALIEIEGVIKRYHDMTDGQRGYSHWPFAGPKPSQ